MKQSYGFDIKKLKENLEGSIIESIEPNNDAGTHGFTITVRPFYVKTNHLGAKVKVQYDAQHGDTELIVTGPKVLS